MASSDAFWKIGHKITGHRLEGSFSMGYRKLRAFFGTSPQVCVIVWNQLSTRRPTNSTPEHLLWGLMLLKQYNIESVNATLVGVSEKNLSQMVYDFNSPFSEPVSGKYKWFI
jgi:hypothetical protein